MKWCSTKLLIWVIVPSRLTFILSHSVSLMSRSKSAQLVDKWLSQETMLMLRCVFCIPTSYLCWLSHSGCSDSVIYSQTINPYCAVFGISNLHQAFVECVQTTLCHVVGAQAVQSVKHEPIAFEVVEIVSDVANVSFSLLFLLVMGNMIFDDSTPSSSEMGSCNWGYFVCLKSL